MKREPDWIKALTDQSRILGPRVFGDDQAFSMQGAAEVVRRLLGHRERTRKTQGWAAAAMGENAGRLSAVIRGSLDRPAAILRTVDKWLEAQALKNQAARPAGFVKTGVAGQIFAVARYCLEYSSIALAHGPAGAGKSFAAKAIHADMPGSIYISIRTAGQTAMAVIRRIRGDAQDGVGAMSIRGHRKQAHIMAQFCLAKEAMERAQRALFVEG